MKFAGLKLKKFLDFSEGFTELLKYCLKNTIALITLLLNAYMNYSTAQTTGGFQGDAEHKDKADMVINTIISLHF